MHLNFIFLSVIAYLHGLALDLFLVCAEYGLLVFEYGFVELWFGRFERFISGLLFSKLMLIEKSGRKLVVGVVHVGTTSPCRFMRLHSVDD